MFRYFKSAFWVRHPVPLLGDLPVNVLALVPFVVLGFLHPGFWLMGLGLEAGFLTMLAMNPRFQRITDLPSALEKSEKAEAARQTLLQRLPDDLLRRYRELEMQVSRTLQSYREFETPSYIADPNTRGLDSLLWVHLKLLCARAALTGPESEGNAARLREQLDKLQQRLIDGQLSSTARKSKQATVALLEKRLHHFDRRTTALEEIDADLIRIETQVALAEDNARLQAKPDTVSLDVDLASDTMRETWYFNEDEDLIETLESTYSQTAVSQ